MRVHRRGTGDVIGRLKRRGRERLACEERRGGSAEEDGWRGGGVAVVAVTVAVHVAVIHRHLAGRGRNDGRESGRRCRYEQVYVNRERGEERVVGQCRYRR